MLNQDHIFAVPVMEQWLIHAPLHGVSALVNKAAVTGLSTGSQKSADKKIKGLLALLDEETENIPRTNEGPAQPEFLGIIATRSCNLNCGYCGFGACEAAAADQMDLATAAFAVDWMVEHVQSIGRKSLDIHFFGGEPFLAPEVVDTVVHHARSRAARCGLIPRFEAATNGFFDEARCQFVGDYLDTVVLSFDGPEEIQNRYRPRKSGEGSYRVVARNAYLLGKSPARLCIRVCVTRETVSCLDQITNWFCKTFQPCMIDFEILRPTAESESAGLSPPDPWEFASMCLRSMAAASRAGVTPVYAAASIETLRHSFCPVGRDTLILSPERRINACYLLEQDWKNRGLDLNLGYMDDAGTMNLDQSAIDRVRKTTLAPGKCQRCLGRWHCAGGCRVANTYPGCPDEYDNFCIQTRIITAYRLLQDLGRHHEAEHLLRDRGAQERLAWQASDRLSDWNE